MIMDRREFLTKAGLVATWAAVSVRVIGCGEDDSNPMNGGDGSVQGIVEEEADHIHAVTITAAQLQAGNAVTLTLSTNSGHSHSVALTADEVMSIAGGGTVVAVSSNNSTHTHVVQFN
jgi:hypothetical protein